MLRGYYIASNALINKQRTIDTLSNNMANVHTAGYKNDMSVKNTFKEELILLNQGRKNKTGTIQYQYTEKSKTDLSQGTMEFTHSPLDVALTGPVYFNIQKADGSTSLSRNGQFSIDDEGYLQLAGAGRVMGEGGPIQVGTDDFSISNQGQIFVNGNYAGNLKLSYVAEDGDVHKNGDNTFDASEGAGNIPEGTQFDVIQGAYERSNVDFGKEMTKVMSAQRSFESISEAIKMIDKINSRTVTEIAKV